MKSVLSLLAVVLCSITFSGCLDWNINIKVNSDGSGMITETTIIPVESSMAEEDNTFILDSIKKSASERFGGVEVVDYKQNKQKGSIKRIVHYSFKNINDVFLNMMGSEVPKEQYPYRFSFKSNNDGTQTLAVIADSTRFNSMKEGIADDDSNMPSKETRKLALNMVKGFKFHFSLATDKPIKQTNALFQKGNIIELVQCDLYDFTKLTYDNKQFRKTMKNMGNTPTKEQISMMKKYNFIVETQDVVNIIF